MKKAFKINGLCCANCTVAMEREINKKGVKATIAFMTQRLIIESDDMENALKIAQDIISDMEPGCTIVK